jgi:hypothetical protein
MGYEEEDHAAAAAAALADAAAASWVDPLEPLQTAQPPELSPYDALRKQMQLRDAKNAFRTRCWVEEAE